VQEGKATTEPLAALPAPPPRPVLLGVERPVPPRRRVLLPVFLFAATCVTTTLVHTPLRVDQLAVVVTRLGDPEVRSVLARALGSGLLYSVPLMSILLAHEMGHFLQALRYRVPASLPYFIPVPFPPLGTMGAVIGMRGLGADRKALFDIGISGPIAGLVVAIPVVIIGLQRSRFMPIVDGPLRFGEPLLFQWLAYLVLGPAPAGFEVATHPIAFAGWVGLFITGLNLMPIGQLDGGHVSYALLRQGAHKLAIALLVTSLVLMVVFQYFMWTLMLILLMLIGPEHPPTANDMVPLGFWRRVLGWASLASVVVLFTPTPFIVPG
jgi:membrane-associated protease RseP (regulator of RpoE activity)